MGTPTNLLSDSADLYWVHVALLIVCGLLSLISFIVQSLKPAKYGKFARPDVKNPYVTSASETTSLTAVDTSSAADLPAMAAGGTSGSAAPKEEGGFPARLSFFISDFVFVIPVWAVATFVIYDKYQRFADISATLIVYWILWATHFIQRGVIHPLILRYSMRNVGWDIFLPMMPVNALFTFINASFLATTVFPSDYESDPRFAIGIIVFVLGFIINRWADWKLRSLRADGSREYRVPTGGLYEYVSCPNYLGEGLEWTGYLIGVWNWAALVWLLFCLSTFVPRARQNHAFYRHTFPDYPKQRKALIPFVY